MGSPAKAKSTADAEPPPRTWWQWVLLYPALFLAIFTAVPLWMEAGAKFITAKSNPDIPPDKIVGAKDQNELFRRNLACTTRPLDDFYLTPKNVKVDATICASGDVFVRMFAPDELPKYHWVDVDKIASTNTASVFSIAAVAAETNQYTIAQNSFQDTSQGSVICQRFLDQRNLLRVVQVNGACFDEMVDTFLGVTVSQTPSQCRSTC